MPRLRGPGVHFVSTRGGNGSEEFWELTQLLKKAVKRVRGLKTHVWKPIGERIILRRVKQRYRTGGLADGDPVANRWPKLAEVTSMIRKEEARKGQTDRGGGQPVKRKTLHLQDSHSFFMGQGKNIVRVGSLVRYAEVQEFGGSVKDAITETNQFVSESDDHQYYYFTGRDDQGKRVRIRIAQEGSHIPPRPAVYMNRQMVDEATALVAEFVRTRFEDGPPTVERILQTAAELKGVPF